MPKDSINTKRISLAKDNNLGGNASPNFLGYRGGDHANQTDEFVDMYIDHYVPSMLISPANSSDKILLYFHANAEDIGQAYMFCSQMKKKLNMFILLVEYRGYGIYDGESSQDSIFDDSQHVWNY